MPTIGASVEDRIQADAFADVVVETIVQYRCAEIFDLRELNNGSEGIDEASAPGIGLAVRLVRLGDEARLSIALRNASSGQVLWTRQHVGIKSEISVRDCTQREL